MSIIVLILKPYNGKESGLDVEISNSTIDGIIITSDVMFTL